MYSPCILMRVSRDRKDEQKIAEQSFPVYELRTKVPPNSLVIGRYVNLPYHYELEQDIINLNSRLINSTLEHQYVANFDYYEDLKDVTFETWMNLEDVPCNRHSESFIVKGRTNSQKQAWNSLMFAQNFKAASRISAELRCDSFIGPQGIIIRKYEELETFEISEINGMPFSNEWRIFYYKGKRLAYGYYWSNIDDWTKVTLATPDFELNGLKFADKIAERIIDKIPFVCIDIAKKQNGDWVLVELNDGCQAGLNDSVPAEELYSNLKLVLNEPICLDIGPILNSESDTEISHDENGDDIQLHELSDGSGLVSFSDKWIKEQNWKIGDSLKLEVTYLGGLSIINTDYLKRVKEKEDDENGCEDGGCWPFP